MAEKIVIIGASVSQDPLIQKAKQMGYETHVFAWKAGDVGESTADFFYPISIMDVETIYQQCLRIRPCAVATIASDHAAKTAQILAQRLGLADNSTETIQCMTNKIALHQTLEGKVPMARWFDADGSMEDAFFEKLAFPCVVKPSDRTGGRGISKVANRNELMEAIDYARDISLERKAIVEAYVYGTEYSCEVFSLNREHRIIACTRVVKEADTSPELRHLEYVQPVHLSQEEWAAVEGTVYQTLNALDYENGPSHIEFVLRDGVVTVLEVSPSVGGDGVGTFLTGASTGLDYIGLVLEYFCGKVTALPEVGSESAQGVAVSKIVLTEEEFADYARLKRSRPGQIVDDAGMHGFTTGRKRFDKSRHGYYVLFQPRLEMGSFLPLELPLGEDPFDSYGGKALGLNSYRAAVLTALRCAGADTVHVPWVYPASMVTAITQSGYRVLRYHVGEDMLPCEDLTGKTAIVMNYFGILDAAVARYAEKTRGRIIVDNSLAYYAPYIEGTWGVYVCTRFLGVSNGAYLVGDVSAARVPETDTAHGRAGHLLKSLEVGTAAAYKEYYTNEQRVGKEILRMSPLTRRLLKAVDHPAVQARRRENYAQLERALPSVLPGLPEGCVPQCFPFAGVPELREKLLENKVFVPYYFRKCAEDGVLNQWERRLVHDVHCLPVDQRYTPVDMEYLVRLIGSFA